MSRSGMVSSLCQELLGDVLSLRGKVYWPQLRDHLLPYLPYLEVWVLDEVMSLKRLCFMLLKSISMMFGMINYVVFVLRM